MTTVFYKNDIEEIPAKLVCESCGRDFSCGANVGECWCFAVELTAESVTKLRARFENCLCENCLNETERILPVEI